MNHAQMEILKSEITADTLTRGYAGMNDLEVAADLNTVYRTQTRDTVSGSEIFNATDDVEYAALSTDAKRASWDALCGIDSINTSSGVAKARETELFGGGTTTRANLAALRLSSVSRATEIGIPTVFEGNVQEARA